MKQLIHSLLVVIVVAAAAMHVKAQTPIEFNDKLSSITDSLYARGQEWGKTFNDAYKSKNFSLLIPARTSLERFVDASIARVKVMKDVKNSQDLRMAMLNFLQFEKGMISRAFKPMESLKPSASEDEVKAALAKLTDYSKEESGELGKVAKAQEGYAEANGFKIEAPAKAEEKGN